MKRVRKTQICDYFFLLSFNNTYLEKGCSVLLLVGSENNVFSFCLLTYRFRGTVCAWVVTAVVLNSKGCRCLSQASCLIEQQ